MRAATHATQHEPHGKLLRQRGGRVVLGKLKTEMVYHHKFTTREEARAAVFEYIEMFYTRQRLHAALDYQSPEQFEASQIGKSNEVTGIWVRSLPRVGRHDAEGGEIGWN